MKQDEIEKAFTLAFQPFFDRLGLRSLEWNLFERQVGDVDQSVAIGPNRKHGGLYDMTAGGLGIRIPVIEAIRQKDKFPDAPTVGMPLHLLKPDKKYRAWDIARPDDVFVVAPEIQAEIERFAIPYFARFGSAEAVLQQLQAQDWHQWFACTPDSRDSIIVYATWAHSGPSEAAFVGRALLAEYEGRLPKFSVSLRDALDRCREATA